MLGVNFDGVTGDDLNQQMAVMDIQFPVMVSFPIEQFGIERPSVLPITYLFAPDGSWRETLVGVQDRKTLEDALAKHDG